MHKIHIHHKWNKRNTVLDLDSVVAVEQEAEPKALASYNDEARKDFHDKREYRFILRGGRELKFLGDLGEKLMARFRADATTLE